MKFDLNQIDTQSSFSDSFTKLLETLEVLPFGQIVDKYELNTICLFMTRDGRK